MAYLLPSQASDPIDHHDVPLQELIFSCGICQALVSEVYAAPESNRGFHGGSANGDGLVTKMWIADCSHITCAKHLEGGAAPFHPESVPPRAICPKCFQDRGDESLHQLYGIHGLADGQYDPSIPALWMECPPMNLDGSIKGIEGVRFQYMALANYSLQVRNRWRSAVQKQSATEAAHAVARKEQHRVRSELRDLKARTVELEKVEARYRKWEERKPLISHYLGVVGDMAREIADMRKQLLRYGCVWPEGKYSFGRDQHVIEHAQLSTPEAAQKHLDAEAASHFSNLASDPNLPRGNTAGLSRPTARYDETSSSAWKRKRLDDPAEEPYRVADFDHKTRRSSRDIMPPPLPKPTPFQQGTPSFKVKETAQVNDRTRLSRSTRHTHPLTSSQSGMSVQQQCTRHDHYPLLQDRTSVETDPFQPPLRPPSRSSTQYGTLPSTFGARLDTEMYQRSTAKSHPSQYFAQLSLGSPVAREHTEWHTAGTIDRLQHMERRPIRMQHDRAQTLLAQQRQEDAIQSHQNVLEVNQNHQPSTPSFAPYPSPTPPTPRLAPRNVAETFTPINMQAFSRSHFGRTQQIPTRDSFISHHHSAPSQNPHRPKMFYPAPNHGRTNVQAPLQEYDQQSPQRGQRLIQRPDYIPLRDTLPSSRQESVAHRGRLSFLPNTTSMRQIAANEDNALSRIHGVRGLSSKKGLLSRPDSVYETAGLLHAAASSRRQVRR